METLRVLIVDDSLVFRKTLADVCALIPEVEVVGIAPNGKIALEKIERFAPDLVTLDLEMPGMSGIEVLEKLNRRRTAPGIVILTGTSPAGGTLAMRALELGAFDFVPKPVVDSIEEGRQALLSSLQPVIRAFCSRRGIRTVLAQGLPQPRLDSDHVPMREKKHWKKADLVIIGISTGGPQSLHKIFSEIYEPLAAPLLIVQHIPPSFSGALAESLRAKHQVPIYEAAHGDLLEPGKVFIAPGGKQMKIRKKSGESAFQICVTDDQPENNCKPSIDYLLRSVAHHFPGNTAVFIMTGMGNDGTTGAALVKRAGGRVFAQDEKSSVVFGMPKAVFEAGVTDAVLPLDQMARKILELAGKTS
jgi:two-component system chemotaxis response regulator CheB